MPSRKVKILFLKHTARNSQIRQWSSDFSHQPLISRHRAVTTPTQKLESDFRSDDRTFTGKFWINIAGNPAPNAQSQDFSGRYLLNLDGSGTLTFLENGIALGEAFIVATNLEADFLIMWSWTKLGTLPPHRRAVATGQMKRMTLGGTFR